MHTAAQLHIFEFQRQFTLQLLLPVKQPCLFLRLLRNACHLWLAMSSASVTNIYEV